MNSMLFYLVEISIVFSILYMVHRIFLEKLTFHKTNRIVLLLFIPVSLVIPFVGDLLPSGTPKNIEIPLFQYMNIEFVGEQLHGVDIPLTSTTNYVSIFLFLYLAVFFVYLGRFLNTLRQLFVLKSQSEIEQRQGYKFIKAPVAEIFSYFNWIFVPENSQEYYNSKIIVHEKMHIQLKHSWDVILVELYIAVFWFNPLLCWYRKSLKSVHEFQADQGVLKLGIKHSEYMQLLLQSLEISKPKNLYNYFNQPILKKRVIMITKAKSSNLTKFSYMLLTPVCFFLITAFTVPKVVKDYNYLKVLQAPHLTFNKNTPSLFPVQNGTKNDISSYFGEKREQLKLKHNVPHRGIDIRAKVGTPVLATADGLIEKASLKGDWGNLIIIIHDDSYETWYAHLDGFNIKENEKVKKGDIIGYVGITGRSTGPHLHYEVKENGKHVNPFNFLEE